MTYRIQHDATLDALKKNVSCTSVPWGRWSPTSRPPSEAWSADDSDREQECSTASISVCYSVSAQSEPLSQPSTSTVQSAERFCDGDLLDRKSYQTSYTHPGSPPPPTTSLTSLLASLPPLNDEVEISEDPDVLFDRQGLSGRHPHYQSSKLHRDFFLTGRCCTMKQPGDKTLVYLDGLDVKSVPLHTNPSADARKSSDRSAHSARQDKNTALPPVVPKPPAYRCPRLKSAPVVRSRFQVPDNWPLELVARAQTSQGRLNEYADGRSQDILRSKTTHGRGENSDGIGLANPGVKVWPERFGSCEYSPSTCCSKFTSGSQAEGEQQASVVSRGPERLVGKEAGGAGKEGKCRPQSGPCSASPHRIAQSKRRPSSVAVHAETTADRTGQIDGRNDRTSNRFTRSYLKTKQQTPSVKQYAVSVSCPQSKASLSPLSLNSLKPFWERSRRPVGNSRKVVEETDADESQTEAGVNRKPRLHLGSLSSVHKRSTASLVQSYRSVLMGNQTTTSRPSPRRNKCFAPNSKLYDANGSICSQFSNTHLPLGGVRNSDEAINTMQHYNQLSFDQTGNTVSKENEVTPLAKDATSESSHLHLDALQLHPVPGTSISARSAEQFFEKPGGKISTSAPKREKLFSERFQWQWDYLIRKLSNVQEEDQGNVPTVHPPDSDRPPGAAPPKPVLARSSSSSILADLDNRRRPLAVVSLIRKPSFSSKMEKKRRTLRSVDMCDIPHITGVSVGRQRPLLTPTCSEQQHSCSSEENNNAKDTGIFVTEEAECTNPSPVKDNRDATTAVRRDDDDGGGGHKLGQLNQRTPSNGKAPTEPGQQAQDSSATQPDDAGQPATQTTALCRDPHPDQHGSAVPEKTEDNHLKTKNNLRKTSAELINRDETPQTANSEVGHSGVKSALPDSSPVREKPQTKPEIVKASANTETFFYKPAGCHTSFSDTVHDADGEYQPSFLLVGSRPGFITRVSSRGKRTKRTQPARAASVKDLATADGRLHSRPIAAPCQERKKWKRDRNRKPGHARARLNAAIDFVKEFHVPGNEPPAENAVVGTDAGDEDIKFEECNETDCAVLLARSSSGVDKLGTEKFEEQRGEGEVVTAPVLELGEDGEEQNFGEEESDDSAEDDSGLVYDDDEEDEKEVEWDEDEDEDMGGQNHTMKPLSSTMMKEYWQQVKKRGGVSHTLARAIFRWNKNMYDSFSRIGHATCSKDSNA